MMPARIELDFAPQRRRFPLLGITIIAIGVYASYWTYTDYQDSAIESELLTMQLARHARVASESAPVSDPADLQAAQSATDELKTPWSVLLSDLESAALDYGKDVALLEIAPNKNKQSVRISGEARTLNHILDYLGRLQDSESMTNPLLESHEVQTAARERPVRFVIFAEWRLSL